MTPLETLSQRVAPRHTALLVIDMQNDFCAEGGYVSKLGRDVTACQAIVPRLETLIAGARRFGVPVLWVQADYGSERVPEPMRLRQSQMGRGFTCCVEGSWGAAPFGLVPGSDEATVVKHSYSGFIGTDLDLRLRAMRVRSLVVAGVQTNVCVESTIRDAHSRGYYSVVPRDAVASHMASEHEATLRNVAFLFGDVVETPDLLNLWEPRAA